MEKTGSRSTIFFLHTNDVAVLSLDPAQEFAGLLVATDRDLRRYLGVFLTQADDVEEVLQQTVMVLWEQFEAYDRSRAFLPWAMKFAYYEVLNFRKTHARSRLIYSQETMGQLVEARKNADETLEARRSKLNDCLRQLNDEDRQLLRRRYEESSTVQELAKSTGRTVKSLYRRLDRIRDALTRCIDRKMISQEGSEG